MIRLTVAILTGFVVAGTSSAQPASDSSKREKAIVAARQRLNQVIDVREIVSGKDDPEEITLENLLDAINSGLSSKEDSKFLIHLDHAAFGKIALKILRTKVTLPPVPRRMSAALVLRLALKKAVPDTFEIEFVARPGEILITTRDHSFHVATYDIRDILNHTEYLHQTYAEQKVRTKDLGFPNDFDDKADWKKPAEWIVRQLMHGNNLRAGWHNRVPASTIEIRNGTTLVVNTVPSVHGEIQDTLAIYRRLADLAVIMEAKVYALERAEYENHFASAFVDPKDKTKRRLVATVTVEQHKKLQGLKPIATSDFEKLRPVRRAEFLTLRSAYQYQAQPGEAEPATAFEGYSFAVLPQVSPDRRCLHLELFHAVNQLVKLTKGTKIDPKTGKEAPIDLPNLRKSSAADNIEIHDGQPILLAVDYRPKDKVWLVLAEPRIYLEEEEEQIRRGPPMPLADEKPPPPEPPVDEEKVIPPVQLPSSKEIEQILGQVVKTVLSDPKIRDTHDFYGTPGDGKFALDNDSRILWPKGFRPAIAGFEMSGAEPMRCRGFERRLMGLRIDQFSWDGKADVKEFAMDIAIHNVGGQANGGVIGACHVDFVAKKQGKEWKVDWTLVQAP